MKFTNFITLIAQRNEIMKILRFDFIVNLYYLLKIIFFWNEIKIHKFS